jgi:hypothetical protein
MSPLLHSRPSRELFSSARTRKTLNPFDGGSGDTRGAGEEVPRLARGLGDWLAADGGRRYRGVLLAKIDDLPPLPDPPGSDQSSGFALSSEAAPPQELEKPDLRAGPLQDAKSSLHLILLRQGHRGTPFHDHREEVRYGNLQQFRRPRAPIKYSATPGAGGYLKQTRASAASP